MPRGTLKSSVITVGKSLQNYIRNPDSRTLISNMTLGNAKGFLGEIAQHLRGQRFQELYGTQEFGSILDDSGKWNGTEIFLPRRRISKEPTFYATSVESNIVSQHFDFIVLDDLVGRKNVGTKDQMDKVIQAYRDYEDILEPDGTMIVVGTRWHFGDLYGWLEEELHETYSHVFKRSIVMGVNLEKDPIFFPQKYTRERILQLRRDKGETEFSNQYMNMPIMPENAVFQRQWFQYWRDTADGKREILTRDGKVIAKFDKLPSNFFMALDPAISERRDGDFSGIVIVEVDTENRWFVHKTLRYRMRPNQLLEKALSLMRAMKIKYFAVETTAYQKSLLYSIQESEDWKDYKGKVKEMRRDTNTTKQMRIAGLQPRYESGKIFHAVAMKDGDLEEELLRHPKPKNDDLSDALSSILTIAKAPPQNVGRDDEPHEAVEVYKKSNSYTGW